MKRYKLPKTCIKGWYLGNSYLYKSDTERVKINHDDWRIIHHAKPLVADKVAKIVFDKYAPSFEEFLKMFPEV